MIGRREWVVEFVADLLDRLGVIDADRFRPTLSIALPRIATGFAIMSKQTADLAMVGIVVGTTGTAGLAFALAYWELVTMVGLGLAGGTVSLVSQSFGGEDVDRGSLVVKQSVLVALAISVPVVIGFFLFADRLIALLGADPESTRHGAAYLTYVAPAVCFELLNLVASRTYAGVGDTYTEMVARAGGAGLNIVISGALIFGVGMGAAGAGLGTTIATGTVTLVLAWGMLGRSYARLGMAPSPVPLSVTRPWIDPTLIRELLEISVPEIARRLAQGVIVFPLLWIAAAFGPVVVAALEVGRRVRGLLNSVNWGMSIASSALVGQRIGANDEAEAEAFGAAILRLSLVLYVALAAFVLAFATPIAGVFVSGPDEVAAAATFVAVGAVSAVGLGIDGAAVGALIGAGDTRWPFVASLLGRYAFALPVAALALVTPLGVVGLYLALLLETFVPGGINYWLFRSGRWKAVSRRYRSTPASVESQR